MRLAAPGSENIAVPILLSRGKKAEEDLRKLDVKTPITVIDPETHPAFPAYAEELEQARAAGHEERSEKSAEVR